MLKGIPGPAAGNALSLVTFGLGDAQGGIT